MPYVLNCTNETQEVRALGNWFSFGPNQMKRMKDEIAQCISETKSEYGLVALPMIFEEDPEYKLTPEGKAELSRYKQIGVENYIRKLRWIVSNNYNSLRQDLEKNDQKVDPAIYAGEQGSDGKSTLDHMRLLAKYQSQKEDQDQKQIDEVKELMKKVK